jgi:hypothetical protein
VNALTGDEEAIAVITKRRDLLFKGIEDGWQGPPSDPFGVAEYHRLAITPRDDIQDPRLIPESSTGARLEFNPNQPKPRVRFSLAHRIGLTLLPDFALIIRNNLKISKRDSSDEARMIRGMICEEQPHRKRPL